MVDGHHVFISPDLGPAAIGFRNQVVVLPEWSAALEPDVRRLILVHESEHVRVNDPRLLLLARLAVIIMPWNIGLWWQVRRLRCAVEIDCDSRVLRTHGDALRYGASLVSVGRKTAASLALGSGFSGAPPLLEERIRAMIMKSRKDRLVRAAGLCMAAMMSFTAAWKTGLAHPVVARQETFETGAPAAIPITAALRDAAISLPIANPVRSSQPRRVEPRPAKLVVRLPDGLVNGVANRQEVVQRPVPKVREEPLVFEVRLASNTQPVKVDPDRPAKGSTEQGDRTGRTGSGMSKECADGVGRAAIGSSLAGGGLYH
jgi:hypothetical protein